MMLHYCCLLVLISFASAWPPTRPTSDYKYADGDGDCSGFDSLSLTPASIDSLGLTDDQIADRVIELYMNTSSSCYIREPDQCVMGTTACDSSTSRVASFYMRKSVKYYGYDYTLIVTNSIPSHCYHVNQQHANPNVACEHYKAMLFYHKPPRGTAMIDTHLGVVGISVSGGLLYNHKSAEATCNVAPLSEKLSFDSCDGHADGTCTYHYHKAPVCIKGWNECQLMGHMYDGFPVYGECEVQISGKDMVMKSNYVKNEGESGCDASHYTYDKDTAEGNLDEANGYLFESDGEATNGEMTFKAGDYAYFFTPEYPFIMPGIFGLTYGYGNQLIAPMPPCAFHLEDIK